jgi:hypothetical protein
LLSCEGSGCIGHRFLLYCICATVGMLFVVVVEGR